MNKRGDKIISVYWFAILFIVAAAIVYMASLFYGAPYDVREIEAGILTNQIADCLSQGGYLKDKVLTEDFRNNFLEKCNLNFNVEDAYDWKEQEQYYTEVNFYEFNQNAPSGFGNRIFNITKGNVNLKTFAVLEGLEARKGVDTVVIHYTAGDTAEDAINTLQDNKLSIHYIIDRSGFIISADNEDERALVRENKIAQHAGCYDPRKKEQRTSCKGEKPEQGEICCINFNTRSIGIELVNLGDVCESAGEACKNKKEINGEFWEEFSDEQIESLTSLVADIASRYNIPIERDNIIGHSEAAPGYKTDPGPAFPWESFIEDLKLKERLSPGIGRSFYVLNKENNKPYIIEILAVVRKTEKNEA